MKTGQRANFRVLSADFITSAYSLEALEGFDLQEVAFVGRSNVGKSSLLNAVCGRKSLAQTSKLPGRTQALNFYRVRISEAVAAEDGETARTHLIHFVDLPGYGHAQVSRGQRKGWAKMIETYLLQREHLAAVVLLIDCRRSVGEEECWIAEIGKGGGLIVSLTKSDKLSNAELNKCRGRIASELGMEPEELIVTSAAAKKKRGIDQLTQKLCSILFPNN